jgi:serine/threonine protein kinase/tetratricopeptide (TPR) repeat protein
MKDLAGETISHYRLIESIGQGGMGVVYKAEDTRLKRTVALKFLPPEFSRDPDAKARFIHEAQATSALQHNNICTVHDIDESDDGQLFIVMDLYDGETLKEKIGRGSLSVDEALDLATQVALGLAKAHAHGIIHRDIKPANILVTSDGVAKIVDFGLAKLTGRSMLTREGSTLGTVAYMSPEQTQGQSVDQRTDIWSLGVVLYEMIVGVLPFKGDYDNVVFYEIANKDPEPVTALRPEVPTEVQRIINKALAKSADERYQQVDEMLADLRRLRKEPESGRSVTHSLARLPRRPRGKFAIASVALLIILVVVFLLIRPLVFEEVLISEPKPIAVIAFTNQTGDSSYNYLREAIPNLLITSLEQSKYLRVMTWERMNDVMKQMGKGSVGVIDKDLGFQLCQREGIHAIVTGSFVKAGDMFATDVKVLDVDSKEILKTASARGDGVQSILASQIDELSKEIARGVGLSQRRIESTPTQIAEVTTSSMDAYNLYLRGRDEIDKLYYPEARRFLEQAVALDSNFAMAYLSLGHVYSGLIEFPKMTQAFEKAKALASRAPEKERLMIQYFTAGNPEKEFDLLQEMVTKYPQEKRFHGMLGGEYGLRGRIRDAEAEYEKAIQLDPTYADPVNNLAYLYAGEGLYDQAIQTLQRYASLSPGDANPFDSMGEMYLLKGNLQEAIAKYSEAIRVQPTFYMSYRSLAYVYALSQDYDEALRWIDSLINSARSIGLKGEATLWKYMYLSTLGRRRESSRALESVARLVAQWGGRKYSGPFYWMKGWAALDKGDANLARREFRTFFEIRGEVSPKNTRLNKALWKYTLASTYLTEGRIDSVRSCVEEMLPQLDSLEGFKKTLPMMVRILNAELLLAEGKSDSAIHAYRETSVPKIAMGIGWGIPFYNQPALRDVVPRAFLKKGQPDSAIAEYERLLRVDPYTNDRRLINPIYHYRLARVCEQVGRIDEAVVEYGKFLDLWKEADRDQPLLIDAKKRLASLRSGKSGKNPRM